MKTVFITGAAAGIGLATARRFAKDGWYVGLYDIDGEGVQRALHEDLFAQACGGRCDVTDRDSIAKALEHFAGNTDGRLDVVVNNAGVLAAGPFENMDPAALDATISVNIGGLTHLAQLAFPYLRQTPASTLVNLCSVSSVHGVPLLAVYSASKFYVNGLSQALGIEWADHGIRVVAIKPPFVKTAMVRGMPEQLMKKFSVDLVPEDVADAIIKALDGSRGSYFLDGKSRLLAILEKFLPAGAGRRIVMWLTGY